MIKISDSMAALLLNNSDDLSHIEASDVNGSKLLNLVEADSLIILRLISTKVIAQENLEKPEEAYEDPVTKKGLKNLELRNLALVLIDLGDISISDSASLDASETSLANLALLTTNESVIIRRLTSRTISSALVENSLTVDPRAYEANGIDFTDLELNELISGLEILEVGSLDEAFEIDPVTITPVKIALLVFNQSYIAKAIVVKVLGFDPF